MFLPAGGEVRWELTLPARLAKAGFLSALKAPEGLAGSLDFQILLSEEGGGERPLFQRQVNPHNEKWEDVGLDLAAYSGKRISLRLVASPGKGGLLLRYPSIDLEGPPNRPEEADVRLAPANTDLSGEFPKISSDDFQLSLNDHLWNLEGLQKDSIDENIRRWRVTQPLPIFRYQEDLNLCLANYSHFYLKIQAAKNIFPRSSIVLLRVREKLEEKTYAFLISLLPGEELHEYSFDLNLLGYGPEARLYAFMLYPIEVKVGVEDPKIRCQISDSFGGRGRSLRRGGIKAIERMIKLSTKK